jgi:hypothetical protein
MGNENGNNLDASPGASIAQDLIEAVEGLETKETNLGDIDFRPQHNQRSPELIDDNQARIELFRDLIGENLIKYLKNDGITDETQISLFEIDIVSPWVNGRGAQVKSTLERLYLAARGGDLLETEQFFTEIYTELKAAFDERVNPKARAFFGETAEKAQIAPPIKQARKLTNVNAKKATGGLKLDAKTKRKLGLAKGVNASSRWDEAEPKTEVRGYPPRSNRRRTGTDNL